MSMIDDAQSYVRSYVADLEGDDDIAPFMILRNEEETLFTGFDMPEEHKDDVADMMAAVTAVWRAQEAIFGSAAWVVESDTPIDCAPSEHPDRKEMVFLVHTNGITDALHCSMLTRQNNGVTMSDWKEHHGDIPIGGRFGVALRLGMDLSQAFPDDAIEYLKREIRDGNIGNVIRPAMRAIKNHRAMLKARYEN